MHTDAPTALHAHGIKPTVQRLAVMDYLMKHPTHPTADEIYQALSADMPTLSRTTVYNTLRLLVEHGAATQLNFEERTACFDAETEPHAHFLCTRCGHLYDVALRQGSLGEQADIPQGFTAERAELFFSGSCCHCGANTDKA